MLHSARASRLALPVLIAAAAFGTAGVGQAAAKAPACPKLTPAQVTRAVGFKFVSAAPSGPGTPFNCFYTLGKGGDAGMNLRAFKGTRAFATEKATIDENIGTINMDANEDDPGTCTPAWGQCKGTSYNGHESPFAGLGQKAIAFPGNKQAGAGAYPLQVPRLTWAAS